MEALLDVRRLKTVFHTKQGEIISVDDVSFSVHPGETVAVVGESGCGKSVTSLSIMGLLGKAGQVKNGEIWFEHNNLTQMSPASLRKLRGRDIAMIFQDPMTSLNPVFTIGSQLVESILQHCDMSRKEAATYAQELLNKVGIARAGDIMHVYPHTLSGGMRQRVMIAMAISCKPRLLIADEPTTALDVTIQAQILELMKQLREEEGAAILLITHDLGVVAEMADRVVVMYAGQVVEEADVFSLFGNPRHPYTQGLLKSIPGGSTFGTTEQLAYIPGIVPHPEDMPKGCRFHPRCQFATSQCTDSPPQLERLSRESTHWVRCWIGNDLEPEAEVRDTP